MSIAENILITVVDDVEARGSQLVQLLKSHSKRVEVNRLDQPLALLAGEPPPAAMPMILLFGCQSPASRHLTAVRQLKERYPGLPLVVYTDAFREVNRIRLMEVGADELLPVESLLEDLQGILPEPLRFERAGGLDSALETHNRMHFQLNSGDEISNALQFLCMSSRKGEMMLMFTSEEKGTIYLADGTVVHAQFRHHRGLEAMAHMMSQGQIEAVFFDGKAAPQLSINLSLSSILLEASVMADEMKG